MLNQLRNALATAQAIQADADAAGMGRPQPQPRRTKPWRNYRFDKDAWGHVRVTIESLTRDRTYYLTPRQYDRFVRLANSGSYRVEIMDSDHGIAWEMRRK